MTTPPLPFEFERSAITLKPIPWSDRFFNPGTVTSPQGLGRYDDEGIAGTEREQRWMDNPVVNAGILLSRLDEYVATSDPVYLNLAIRHAERMVQLAYQQNGALYFPYMHEWHLHGFVADPMETPWFSGMAQGYMLAAMGRLFEITGDTRYRDLAAMVFESFLQVRAESPIWVSDILDGRFLWFEEYARNNGPSDRAFNGHIYATWGLHDYWMTTGDERAEALVDGGLTSLLHYLDRWRYPGGQSFYCLSHRDQSAMYHGVHIGQLPYVFSMTAEPIFLKIADVFLRDYPMLIYANAVNSTIHIEPGTYTAYWSAGLTPDEMHEITFDQPADLTWDVRGSIRGTLDTHARSIIEPYNNVWFKEEPGKVWTNGFIDHIRWAQPLAITPTSAWDGRLWRYDAEADRLTVVAITPVVGSSLQSYRRAKLNGRHCYEISGGDADGLWIAVDAVEIG